MVQAENNNENEMGLLNLEVNF